jgi:hypothetical protein
MKGRPARALGGASRFPAKRGKRLASRQRFSILGGPWMQTFLTLIGQLLLALVAAMLALRGSRSQKWWERQADLYSQLVKALYDIHNYNAKFVENYYEELTSNASEAQLAKRKEKEEALLKSHFEGKAKVDELAVIGTFLISAEVQEDLLHFKKEEAKAWRLAVGEDGEGGDFLDAAEHMSKAANKCLEKVREHAKDDLGLNGWTKRIRQSFRWFAEDQFFLR